MSKSKSKQNEVPKITDDQKKIILDVVLKTTSLSLDEAKTLYLQSLHTYINMIENESTENKKTFISAVNKYKPKFFQFDYNAALASLQEQGIMITKKDLSKYVNLK